MPWPKKRKSDTSTAPDQTKDDGQTNSKYFKHDPKTEDSTSSGKSSIIDSKSKLNQDFYEKSCEDLAKALLGKKLVHRLDNGDIVAGNIVETEAYLGREDKAAHSYNGKKSAKNEAMYMEPGTIYVYHIYGKYTCINISSQGEGAAVLIRGIDATHGIDEMRKFRSTKRDDGGAGFKECDMGNGPSKLTQALNIDKATFNKEHICTNENMWIQPGFDVDPSEIVISSRVGVDSAEEWAKKPLRFYVKGNKSISVRDKEAEKGEKSQKMEEKTEKPEKQETDGPSKSKNPKQEPKKKEPSSESQKKVSSATPTKIKASSSSSTSTVKPDLKLNQTFYEKSCEELAKDLLGKKLVHRLDNGDIVAGDIVEIEAYLGREDKAAHSYNGKKSAKNEAMYMEPGTIYVYHIYGKYTCINISSQGEGAAVLIRGIDATHGIDQMRKFRSTKRDDGGAGLKECDMGSGPSKLTQALNIDKATFNKEHICTNENIWIQPGFDVDPSEIVSSSRVGVDYAEEWAKKPLRFYVMGNKGVSVRDKAAEQNIA